MTKNISTQKQIRQNKELEAKKKKRNTILIGAGILAFFAGSIAYNVFSANNPPEASTSNPAAESISLEDLETLTTEQGVEITSTEDTIDLKEVEETKEDNTDNQ